MSSPPATSDALGAQVHRLPFAVQTARRFVLGVFGGLTLMVTIWATLMLNSTVFSFEGESRGLFRAILIVFVTIIVVGFSVAWWILSRYPRALIVRERGVVLDHGSRSRTLAFDEITGIDQRDADGTPTFVVLVKDGSEIPFGTDRDSEAAAAALVKQAGLTWTEEPYRARRSG
ncbi:MAG TPA: hypothetical protein VNN72_07250 [Polyangiaceae bacterium]|nr:hypothetical protein [Polyangiaceae bacterium]